MGGSGRVCHQDESVRAKVVPYVSFFFFFPPQKWEFFNV